MCRWRDRAWLVVCLAAAGLALVWLGLERLTVRGRHPRRPVAASPVSGAIADAGVATPVLLEAHAAEAAHGTQQVPLPLPTRADMRLFLLPLDANALVAYYTQSLDMRDAQMLQAVRERLMQGDAVAMSVLRQLLVAGEKQEMGAFSLLMALQTPASLALAMGHLMGREGLDDTQGRHLVALFGDRVTPDAVDVMIRMALSADAQGRMRLLQYLVPAIHTEEALMRLLVVAAEFDWPYLNDVVMETVFGSGKSRSAQMLQDLLLTHPDPEVQRLAAEALAQIGDAEACKFLAAQGAINDVTGDCCIDALAMVSSGYSQAALLEVAGDRSQADAVRMAAVQALSSRSDPYVRRQLRNIPLRDAADPLAPLVIEIAGREADAPSAAASQRSEEQRQDEIWF